MGSNAAAPEKVPGAGSSTNEAESRSDEAEAAVRSTLNGLKELTTAIDTPGRITHINSQAIGLYETTEETAIGQVPNYFQVVEQVTELTNLPSTFGVGSNAGSHTLISSESQMRPTDG